MSNEITHDTYEILLNLIAYWLISNNKKFQKRSLYEYQGRTADLRAVESAITSRKKNASSDGLTGRYVEAAVVDNSDLSFLPNTVTYNNVVYTKAQMIDMIHRDLKFESANGRIPATITVNASNTSSTTNSTTSNNTLKPYLTTKGCKGMGQCTAYYCACNSVQQSIYRLTGIQVDESTLAKVMGTTTSGTSHNGINTAIAWFNKTYKYNLKIEWRNFSDLGNGTTERFKKLQSLIDSGAVFFHLLYRNKYGHYEVPQKVNLNNSTLEILNSLGSKCNSQSYCGYIEIRSFKEQLSYINGISQKSVCIITK